MSKTILGIDIGSQYIKIAEVIKKNKVLSINNPAVIRTPAFLMQGSRIPDDSGLVSLLKNTLTKYKYRTNRAVIILNDTLVITRDSEVPPATKKEMEKVLRLEASEHLPVDIKEYIFRFRTLVTAGANPAKVNYMLTASAREDLIMDFFKAFRNAGLKPKAIDISVNSMIKYYEAVMSDKSIIYYRTNTPAIIDIGASSIKLAVFGGGLPVYQQVISYNNAKVDLMISSSLNINREQAEMHKINFGLGYLYEGSRDETAVAVGQIINSHVNNMLNELYKYLQNYMVKFPSYPVTEIVMTGGMSNMKGLDRYIGQSLSLPCSVVKTPDSFFARKVTGKDSDAADMINCSFPLFTGILGAAAGGGV